MSTSFEHFDFIQLMNLPSGDHQGVVRIIRYRFRSDSSFYYVDLYQFEKIEGTDVFGIKFFPKSWRDHPDKYKVVLNKKWTIKPRKIIFTILAICVDHYKKYPNASFAFFGERRQDECIKSTKRFRVYSIFASFFISNYSFFQYWDESTSTYMLLNKGSEMSDEFLNRIKDYFSEYLEER